MPSESKGNKYQTDDEDVDMGLLNQKFPKFNCICELCDCGCVQRKGGHSKNCKKQHHKKLGDDKPCMLSHYQQTFQRPGKDHSRRLPMIPPPTPRDHDRPPMDLMTTQRADFTQRGEGQRAGLLKRPENYETSDAPVENKTSYNQSFQGQASFPAIKMTRPGTQHKTRLVNAKFDSRTTNKESFRDWIPEPAIGFKDLPSFAGSILYPGKTLCELQSTTQVDFPGAVAPRPEQSKMAPGNITIEGSQDHSTTSKLAYVDMGTGHKATNMKRLPQMNTNRHAKFESQTQTMKDYSRVARSQPSPRKPAQPHPETIRLSFDSRLDFTTEQRSEYEGHDTNVHKRADLAKKTQGNIDRPNVKFHTNTTNKDTYRPLDVREGYIPKSKAIERARRIPTSAKFDDQTMNKRYFKNWGAKPRVRYTNIRESMRYIPPREPMETETSTTSVYRTPIYIQQLDTFKPVEQPMDHAGKQDFRTVHKETYQGSRPKPCKATLFLLQQEMKKRRAAQSHQHQRTLTV
ncbi:uncharacterized protein [Amphiura filiformis]|uniref:uncharacterized protein n=1 Tax=Amphiura filiformis TaxID=82378 RepID=UPI003B20EF66